MDINKLFEEEFKRLHSHLKVKMVWEGEKGEEQPYFTSNHKYVDGTLEPEHRWFIIGLNKEKKRWVKWVKKYFGKKCPDFEKDCHLCDIWKSLEEAGLV